MPTVLTICIPTLNRCAFLCKALTSIFEAQWDARKVELCISNNASQDDYSAVEQLLAAAPQALSVRYVVQAVRLPVDEHMLAVKNLATSAHVYFLGDDDFFLEGQLAKLLELVEREAPDLAIFNGTMVNGNDEVIGRHFSLAAQRYPDACAAFADLRDKGMFGAVLVKKVHLNDVNFRYLLGTAHGYGCYWFSLLAENWRQQAVVMIPPFPLVALRMAAKSYSHVEVYFRDIPYEIAVYQRYLSPGVPQRLNEQFKARYMRKISSTMFLTQMRNSGVDLMQIKDIAPGFFRQHRLKIAMSNFLASSGTYNGVRSLYRLVFRRKVHPL